jgi:hypothetical protein
VQHRAIDTPLADGAAYDLIFDSNGAGEIADVVSLRVTNGLARARCIACKYSSRTTPGVRVKDSCEVSGRAP